MVSGFLIKYNAPLWLVGFFPTAVIGLFRSSMLVSCSFDGSLLYDSPVVVFFIVGIRDSGISIPLSLLMLSYANWLFDPTSVPVRITINKLNLIPKRLVSGVVSVLWKTAEVWVRASCDSHHNWPHRKTNDNTLLLWNCICLPNCLLESNVTCLLETILNEINVDRRRIV